MAYDIMASTNYVPKCSNIHFNIIMLSHSLPFKRPLSQRFLSQNYIYVSYLLLFTKSIVPFII
jgi:hypothetical protein